MANIDEEMQIRICLLYEFKLKRSVIAATANIRSVWGEYSISESKCQLWFEQFREGNTSLDEEPGFERQGSVSLLKYQWADSELASEQISLAGMSRGVGRDRSFLVLKEQTEEEYCKTMESIRNESPESTELVALIVAHGLITISNQLPILDRIVKSVADNAGKYTWNIWNEIASGLIFIIANASANVYRFTDNSELLTWNVGTPLPEPSIEIFSNSPSSAFDSLCARYSPNFRRTLYRLAENHNDTLIIFDCLNAEEDLLTKKLSEDALISTSISADFSIELLEALICDSSTFNDRAIIIRNTSIAAITKVPMVLHDEAFSEEFLEDKFYTRELVALGLSKLSKSTILSIDCGRISCARAGSITVDCMGKGTKHTTDQVVTTLLKILRSVELDENHAFPLHKVLNKPNQQTSGSLNEQIQLLQSEADSLDRGFYQSFVAELCELINRMVRHGLGGTFVLVNKEDPYLDNLPNKGISLNAPFSSDLLYTMLCHSSPLHDGALIIRLLFGHAIIHAAKVFFPLREAGTQSRGGTRHHTALEFSAQSNVSTVLIVSEETGRVSLAKSVEMKTIQKDDLYMDDDLKNAIVDFLSK